MKEDIEGMNEAEGSRADNWGWKVEAEDEQRKSASSEGRKEDAEGGIAEGWGAEGGDVSSKEWFTMEEWEDGDRYDDWGVVWKCNNHDGLVQDEQ